MPYEFNGEAYKTASTHQKEWGNQIIANLTLNGTERILDLGCGDGALTAQLAAKVPGGSVLGIDSSQSMIDTALQHLQPNLSFRVLDINNLDYDDEFDVIFSNAALHWVLNHQALLFHCYKSLKKSGYLRLNFAADGNCATFYKIVKAAMEIPQYRRYFLNFKWPWYMPSVPEYEELVKKQPFIVVKVWGEKADRYFPDAESITKWIDQPSLVPFKASLQPPGRTFFRDLVVQRMLEATRQPDGTYFEFFQRINVLARK
jgi:trans-aconitate 2-methyltransferase